MSQTDILHVKTSCKLNLTGILSQNSEMNIHKDGADIISFDESHIIFMDWW